MSHAPAPGIPSPGIPAPGIAAPGARDTRCASRPCPSKHAASKHAVSKQSASKRVAWIAQAALLFGVCTAAPVWAQTPQRESLIDPAVYRGLAADHRAFRVGDVLTVNVLEATRARSQAATEAGSELEMSAGFRSPSTQFDADLGIGASNNAGAQTTRLGELRTQVSVRVIDVEPNGLLRIAGEQSLLVNGETQRIRLSGVVRAEDIDSGNAVWSNRIADAGIELLGVGTVSESQRQSVLYRVMKWLRLI